jgi:hypothetical protein
MNEPKVSQVEEYALASFKKWQDLSMTFLNDAFTAGQKLNEAWLKAYAPGSTAKSTHAVPCCPPEKECPPHCIASINREAQVGEVIVVSFALKNCCGGQKVYRIGVRAIKDQYGKEVSTTPQLDKNSVALDPHEVVQVRLTLSLTQEFKAGHTYRTEIVIREKEVNQNICLTLKVMEAEQGPVVCPLDESKYLHHFQSWDSHFYCEEPRKTTRIDTPRD